MTRSSIGGCLLNGVIFLAACVEEVDGPARCQSSRDADTVHLDLDRGAGARSLSIDDAGTATASLIVTAHISCIRGSATAALSTSSGSVAGSEAGKTVSVALSAAGAADEDLTGYAELKFLAARPVRLEARLAEWYDCRLVGVVESAAGDAGATIRALGCSEVLAMDGGLPFQ